MYKRQAVVQPAQHKRDNQRLVHRRRDWPTYAAHFAQSREAPGHSPQLMHTTFPLLKPAKKQLGLAKIINTEESLYKISECSYKL